MTRDDLPVRKIDEGFHRRWIHALTSDLDFILAALGHVMSEHGVKVWHSRSQNDSVSPVRVVANLKKDNKKN